MFHNFAVNVKYIRLINIKCIYIIAYVYVCIDFYMDKTYKDCIKGLKLILRYSPKPTRKLSDQQDKN